MAEQIHPGEFVTFVRQGGILVTIVRYGGTYVRVTPSGGKAVTHVRYGGGIPVTVDDEKKLPQEIQDEIGM